MATTTERIYQSTGLEADIATIEPRELGITSDTERPVIGSSVAGPKFIGTEEFISIITPAPAALSMVRRSRSIVYVDTSTAGASVALDIQAGAQKAGYAINVICFGPDERQAAVTYGVGLVEYIPSGCSQEFVWSGTAWLKSRLSWADRYKLGSVIDGLGDDPISAKNPVVKIWDGSHDVAAANYPVFVPYLRSIKIKTYSGSAWVTDHAVTVAGSVLTGSGTAWTRLLAALAEDYLVHGSTYTNWHSINVAGTDYTITNINTGAGTITVSGTPTAGSQTAIMYAYRITGSTTSARLYADTGRALMSLDGNLRVSGLRRRFHMHGHYHGERVGADGALADSNTLSTAVRAGAASTSAAQLRAAATQTITHTIKDPIADPTNGTPVTGPETEPNSSTVFREVWAGVYIA